MTWKTFKKKFNPQVFSVADSKFGTKSIVNSTMTSENLRFHSKQILDIDEHYNYKNVPKPLDIVKEMLDVYKYTYVVYYVWRHRDCHGRGIDVYYR